jgi:hypothetical protein
MALKRVQVVHKAAVAAHKKAKPVFEKAEHGAAISYALHELGKFLGFVYAHELVVGFSGVLLVALAVALVGRGIELVLVALGMVIAAGPK